MAVSFDQTLLDEVKTAIGVTENDYDMTIAGVIGAAIADMDLLGVETGGLTTSAPDPLLKLAVITYVRANFGEDKDSEKYNTAYQRMLLKLMLAEEY